MTVKKFYRIFVIFSAYMYVCMLVYMHIFSISLVLRLNHKELREIKHVLLTVSLTCL